MQVTVKVQVYSLHIGTRNVNPMLGLYLSTVKQLTLYSEHAALVTAFFLCPVFLCQLHTYADEMKGKGFFECLILENEHNSPRWGQLQVSEL